VKEFLFKGRCGTQLKCGLEIKESFNGYDVFLSDLEFNEDGAVERLYERIATAVYLQHLTDKTPNQVIWYQRIPKDGIIPERLERVELRWRGSRFVNPIWEEVEIRKTKY
jgi:hypothetical protein